MNDYVIINGELYHYGVKGMKWGIRRDAHVLANNRRNKRVRNIKNDYVLGKIDKATKKSRIQQANQEKKAYLKNIKEKLANVKSKKQLERIHKDIAKQTINEVPHHQLKKGARTALNVLNAYDVGVAALNTIAISAAINPAVGLAAGGITAAYATGLYSLGRMGIDKLS